MIRSMTAYARREIKGEWGSATWEMRSVNQRYLETYFRLPEQFRSLEPVVRERIRSRLTRGKVECTLRYEPDVSAQGELILNEKLAKQLVTAANWVKMQSDEGEINPVDILRWPGVMAAQEQDLDAIAATAGPGLIVVGVSVFIAAYTIVDGMGGRVSGQPSSYAGMVFAFTPLTASMPVAPASIPMVPLSWNTQSKI